MPGMTRREFRNAARRRGCCVAARSVRAAGRTIPFLPRDKRGDNSYLKYPYGGRLEHRRRIPPPCGIRREAGAGREVR